MPASRLHIRSALLVFAGLIPAAALAQPVTWTGTISGSWNTAGNWSPSGVPVSSNDTQLTFGATPNPTMVNDIGTLILNSMAFNVGAPSYSLSGNGLNFQTNNSGGLPQIVSNSSNAVSIGTLLTLNNNMTVSGTGNVMLSSGVGGPGSLTMAGAGRLTLSGDNSFAGGLNVSNGTVAVATYVSLGAGNVTGGPLGTLIFTGPATTFKSFAMNGGTLAVAAGQTVNFSGGPVTAAYLDGAGTFATSASGAQFINDSSTPSLAIISNSAADVFRNFTNSAALTVPAGLNTAGTSTTVNFNGFSNQGLGSITIGMNTQVNVSNFQSYGNLHLLVGTKGSNTLYTLMKNTGTAPLALNSGSRTFINYDPYGPEDINEGIDLNGKNAIVAGGLLVNDGFVIDSSNGGSGTATIVSDFGALVKGNGFYQNNIITRNGGKFQSGLSPGKASFGHFTFGPGGVDNYLFDINDATGVAGPMPDADGRVSGWSLVKGVQQAPVTSWGTPPGDFSWSADPAHKLTIHLDTLVNPTTIGTDIAGPMANFDPSRVYSWPAVQWVGNYSGPSDPEALDAATSFDTSGFLNPIAGNFGWQLDTAGHTLSLTYTPSAVPEPSALALTFLAGLGWSARCLRRPNRPDPLDPFFQIAEHIPQDRFR